MGNARERAGERHERLGERIEERREQRLERIERISDRIRGEGGGDGSTRTVEALEFGSLIDDGGDTGGGGRLVIAMDASGDYSFFLVGGDGDGAEIAWRQVADWAGDCRICYLAPNIEYRLFAILADMEASEVSEARQNDGGDADTSDDQAGGDGEDWQPGDWGDGGFGTGEDDEDGADGDAGDPTGAESAGREANGDAGNGTTAAQGASAIIDEEIGDAEVIGTLVPRGDPAGGDAGDGEPCQIWVGTGGTGPWALLDMERAIPFEDIAAAAEEGRIDYADGWGRMRVLLLVHAMRQEMLLRGLPIPFDWTYVGEILGDDTLVFASSANRLYVYGQRRNPTEISPKAAADLAAWQGISYGSRQAADDFVALIEGLSDGSVTQDDDGSVIPVVTAYDGAAIKTIRRGGAGSGRPSQLVLVFADAFRDGRHAGQVAISYGTGDSASTHAILAAPDGRDDILLADTEAFSQFAFGCSLRWAGPLMEEELADVASLTDDEVAPGQHQTFADADGSERRRWVTYQSDRLPAGEGIPLPTFSFFNGATWDTWDEWDDMPEPAAEIDLVAANSPEYYGDASAPRVIQWDLDWEGFDDELQDEPQTGTGDEARGTTTVAGASGDASDEGCVLRRASMRGCQAGRAQARRHARRG